MQLIHFETWQILLLIFGGLLYIVFTVLKAVKNSKAKKLKAENSLSIDSEPDTSEGDSDG